MSRVLSWFSCGDSSAVAASMAVKKHGGRAEVLYCDTFAYEHPDNRRFFADIERWIGREIKVLRSNEYSDIYDVFHKTGWLVGPKGARCTAELKKKVRFEYQEADDVHVFGFTVDERRRAENFERNNPELLLEFPLIEAGVTKRDCHLIMRDAGIELPMMYRLGYKNNNCIGCVKGQAGYWNKIRQDFPDIFWKMAATERRLNAAICKREGKNSDGTRWRKRVFLDELPPDQGRYTEEPDIECGVGCISPPNRY